jgi:enoyl-CoA hydratase
LIWEELEMAVHYEPDGAVVVVTIDRPAVRNAVDRDTAKGLVDAFRRFEADEALAVAILTGAGSAFCAGADLKAVATGSGNRISPGEEGPLGPTRMRLSKPVIAAVEGHAVAGGLELALWCDMRVAARDAVFGVYCRRWGVPLCDGGTVRLPRLIGESHAMDLILTGRGVGGDEALRMGLANRIVEPGQALATARELAAQIAAFPQRCLRSDRLSALEQWDLPFDEAIANEMRRGIEVVNSGETRAGAARFVAGAGRHGSFAT